MDRAHLYCTQYPILYQLAWFIEITSPRYNSDFLNITFQNFYIILEDLRNKFQAF